MAVEASPPMPQCHTRFGGWLEVRPPPSFWQRGTLLPLPLLLLLLPPRCHKGFPYSGFVVALPSSGGGGERETKSTVGRCQQRGRTVSHSSAERESSPLPLLLLRQCSDAMKMFHSSPPREYHHACSTTREKLSRPRLFFSPPPLLPWGDGDRARVPILPPHDCRRRRGGGGRGPCSDVTTARRRRSLGIGRSVFLSLSRSAANGREAKRRTEDGGRWQQHFRPHFLPFFPPPPFPSALCRSVHAT